MKIILLQSVRGLGDPGQLVNVKSGYARNYLIPNDMAIYATKGNISQAEFQIAKTKELEEKRIAELQEVCNKLNKVTLKYELQASEEDKLFGSVTPQMVSEQLLENGFNVEKKDIAIPDPIKSIGSHYVDIFLHKDVVAKVKVKVKALSV
ncbi:50S ribosomal protein L9 [bacterium]|nr:MAG: 50S ribosomal protein L9 [bacterium TMED6]RCL86473.1 MAG: 50S ribosomal protein L9 [bacterium]|tara:strand:+ start:12300 stop:12749 length:450 start_codon:yes stop_codon:yes gene_type:complete